MEEARGPCWNLAAYLCRWGAAGKDGSHRCLENLYLQHGECTPATRPGWGAAFQEDILLAGRCFHHQNPTCVLCAIRNSVAMRLRENTYLHLYQKQRGMFLTYRDVLKIEKKN